MNASSTRWAAINAVFGATVWLGLKALPPQDEVGIGTIEHMFLFAPLVLVPLALPLVGLERMVFAQPFAALLVAVSFCLPTGFAAATLVAPWAALTFIVGVIGLIRFAREDCTVAGDVCLRAAMVMLPVGGIGLLQSRFGALSLGFHEPLVLLVAVHFHYAAFVAPVVVGLGLKWLGKIGRSNPFQLVVALCIIVGSPLMALGFVLHQPWMRTVAAFALGGGLALYAMLVFVSLRTVPSRLAQVLLALSTVSILASMWLAVLYTLGDLRGEVWISIPQMARTHGVLNAFGFSLCGLLGWTLAQRTVKRDALRSQTFYRRPQTLLSRWE